MSGPADGNDPRRGRAEDPFIASRDLDNQPTVGRTTATMSPFIIVGGFAVLAIILFLVLNAGRTDKTESLVTPSNEIATAAPSPPPLNIAPRPPVAAPPAAAPVPVRPAIAPPPPQTDTDEAHRLHAPVVVVDLQSENGGGTPIPMAPAAGNGAVANPSAGGKIEPAQQSANAQSALAAGGNTGSALLAGGSESPLGASDQFAARVSVGLPEAAVATQLSGLGTTITQGAIIPGVLETAINSDLPGYTRAVVSRDVRSFDGKAVLIPRGSRLIGQYQSALALGQSRVFIIWTRVIRPDGVSIQIGSPGDDALGRGGLGGKVNSHFFARFGGSILLSVLDAGVAAIGTPSTQISIGSPGAAVGAASAATIPAAGAGILPTVKVKQGAPINIFVARDLDFSGVKPVRDGVP